MKHKTIILFTFVIVFAGLLSFQKASAATDARGYGGASCSDESGNTMLTCRTLNLDPHDNINWQVWQGSVSGSVTYHRYGSNFGAGRIEIRACLGRTSMFESGAPCWYPLPITKLTQDNGTIPISNPTSGLLFNDISTYDYNYLIVQLRVASASISFSAAGVEARRVSINTFTSSNSNVTVGQSFNINWETDLGFLGQQLLYDVPGMGSGTIDISNRAQGSQSFTPTAAGTARFTLVASGPGNNGPTTIRTDQANPAGAQPGDVTVNITSSNGTVNVVSNAPTNWQLSGPTTPASGSGTSGGYTVTPGPYHITADSVAGNGYILDTITPAADQNVAAGGSITFTLNYRQPGGTTPPQSQLTVIISGPGTVTDQNGVTCTTQTSPCPKSYNTGSPVTLTASSAWDRWGGICTGAGNPCSAPIPSGNVTVYAYFNSPPPGQYTLSVNKSGTGSGTVTSTNIGGINCGTACSTSFTASIQVILHAQATNGTFVGWSGDCGGGTNDLTCTMNGNKNVTATFNSSPVNPFTLTVSKSGSGTVTSTPGGISCGATCQASFEASRPVTLSAIPASGWNFAGWSGDCGGGSSGSLTCTMNGNKNVTATFTQITNPGTGKVCVTANTADAYTVTGPDQTWNWAEAGQKCFDGHTTGFYSVGFYSVSATGTISPPNGQTLNRDQTINFTVTFGDTPPPPGFGTVCITANTADAYFVSGQGSGNQWGWTQAGQACFSGHPTGFYTVAATGACIDPAAGQTLNANQTINFNVTFGCSAPPPPPPPVSPPASGSFQITYTLIPINTPTVTGVNNATCGKLIVSWSFSGSGLEDALNLYRSTDNASWGNLGQFGPSSGSYTDTPPTNATYYYMLRSHSSVPYSRESGNSNSGNSFSQSCLANLSNSNKTLSLVNGTMYTPATKIKNGDTLTFQIIISNAGPAAATINYICDTPSANITNIRSLQTTGGSNGGIGSCTGGTRLSISGVKAVGNPNWVITFDATLNTTSSEQLDNLSNSAGINYTDNQARVQNVSTGGILFQTGNAKAPNFREVAP